MNDWSPMSPAPSFFTMGQTRFLYWVIGWVIGWVIVEWTCSGTSSWIIEALRHLLPPSSQWGMVTYQMGLIIMYTPWRSVNIKSKLWCLWFFQKWTNCSQDSILSVFCLCFGRIRNFIICFRDLLTFRVHSKLRNFYRPLFVGFNSQIVFAPTY